MAGHSAASAVSSHSPSQCLPFRAIRHLKGAELRRAAARVGASLFGPGSDGLACEQLAERAAAAGAHRLTRRAPAGPAPLPEPVLDGAGLSPAIGGHPE